MAKKKRQNAAKKQAKKRAKKGVTKRNPIAPNLAAPNYRMRVVKKKQKTTPPDIKEWD